MSSIVRNTDRQSVQRRGCSQRRALRKLEVGSAQQRMRILARVKQLEYLGSITLRAGGSDLSVSCKRLCSWVYLQQANTRTLNGATFVGITLIWRNFN